RSGRGRCSGLVPAGAATRCARGTTRWDCRAAARWGRPLPPPRTPSPCRGPAAAMEAIVQPQGWDHWDTLNMRPVLKALRSEAGEAMVLQDNFFIEQILPKAILRPLSAEEMAQYRRPFAKPGEGRRPTLTWPRQI